MIQNLADTNDFYSSLEKTSQNSLNFENSMTSEPYTNEELNYAQITNTNLCLNDSIFISRYYDKLFEDATKTLIERKDQGLYYRNPKRLSYDKFGTIDYWYLILILNGWNCAYEMTDLNRTLLLPNPVAISEIITNEEFYSV